MKPHDDRESRKQYDKDKNLSLRIRVIGTTQFARCLKRRLAETIFGGCWGFQIWRVRPSITVVLPRLLTIVVSKIWAERLGRTFLKSRSMDT